MQQDVRERWGSDQMGSGYSGHIMQQYQAGSDVCVKDEIYIRSREDVTEIPWVPHWSLGHKLRPGLGITMIWVSFYSVHMWEGESGSTKFKQLVWARESGARSKYFTIFLKIFYKNLCEAWAPPPLGKVKSEIKIIVHKDSDEKSFVGRGWNVKWYVKH